MSTPLWQKKYLISLGVFGLLLVGSLGTGGYLYKQLQAAKNQNPVDQQVREAAEVAALIAEVGSRIVLPAGEQPTIATVDDLEKLKGQPFFANAQPGYKVLIFAVARKVILYDPTAKKVVEVAPLNPPEKKTGPSDAPSDVAATP